MVNLKITNSFRFFGPSADQCRSSQLHRQRFQTLLSISMQITDDLNKLLDILPESIRHMLSNHPSRDSLIEVVLDMGRLPEARFPTSTEYITSDAIGSEDLHYCIERVEASAVITALASNKLCIGSALFAIAMARLLSNFASWSSSLRDHWHDPRPGRNRKIYSDVRASWVGKTTALREIARVLADELDKRVVIIDTSNEIAGMVIFLILRSVGPAGCRLPARNSSIR